MAPLETQSMGMSKEKQFLVNPFFQIASPTFDLRTGINQ
jgi:hypothetical protein